MGINLKWIWYQDVHDSAIYYVDEGQEQEYLDSRRVLINQKPTGGEAGASGHTTLMSHDYNLRDAGLRSFSLLQ